MVKKGVRIMLYELSELDVDVIKCSLKAHLKQCLDFIKFDDKVKTFDDTERFRIEQKIRVINLLLENMQFTILQFNELSRSAKCRKNEMKL